MHNYENVSISWRVELKIEIPFYLTSHKHLKEVVIKQTVIATIGIQLRKKLTVVKTWKYLGTLVVHSRSLYSSDHVKEFICIW